MCQSFYVRGCLACCSAVMFSVAALRSSFIHLLEKEPGISKACCVKKFKRSSVKKIPCFSALRSWIIHQVKAKMTFYFSVCTIILKQCFIGHPNISCHIFNSLLGAWISQWNTVYHAWYTTGNYLWQNCNSAVSSFQKTFTFLK